MDKLIDGLLSNLASKGRYGDTELAHVNEKEASLLKSLGGAGTINPKTGLKEYHLPDNFYTWLWTPGMAWHAKNRFEDMHGYRYEGAWPITGDFDDKMENEAYRRHATIDDEYHGYVIPEEPGETEQPSYTGDDEAYNYMRERFSSWGESPYEEWEDLDQEELARYVNPETGEITDEQRLISYLQKVNPELAKTDDEGRLLRSREEIIQWAKDLAPDVFASREDIAGVTEGYQSSAALSREKAKGARFESSMASGISGVHRPGQYGFGGSDESITKGLYADIGSQFDTYRTDIFGLESKATEDYGDFVYGLTDTDSTWYKDPTDYS
jgi:hypothetical protein